MEPTTNSAPSQDIQGSVALTRTIHSNHSTMSVLSATYATALDVCTAMYGEGTDTASSDAEAIERCYETSASIYENPVLTATSRSLIADIHALSRQLSAIDVPRPIALLCTLLRLQPPQSSFLARSFDAPLFRALRVWTEIGDICENESFDGQRKTIVEHTLNILILPGIHSEGYGHKHFRAQLQPSSDSLVTSSNPNSMPASHPTVPGLRVPGTSLTFPSPLHFQLHIITRLSFNEQGRITHHRDFWDVRDVLGLVPGASLAQWVGTRLAARSVAWAAGFWPLGSPGQGVEREQDKMEKGMMAAGHGSGVAASPAAQLAEATREAQGMQ